MFCKRNVQICCYSIFTFCCLVVYADGKKEMNSKFYRPPTFSKYEIDSERKNVKNELARFDKIFSKVRNNFGVFNTFPVEKLDSAKVEADVRNVRSNYRKIVNAYELESMANNLSWYVRYINDYVAFIESFKNKIPIVSTKELKSLQMVLDTTDSIADVFYDTSNAYRYLTYKGLIHTAKGAKGYNEFLANVEKDEYLNYLIKYVFGEEYPKKYPLNTDSLVKLLKRDAFELLKINSGLLEKIKIYDSYWISSTYGQICKLNYELKRCKDNEMRIIITNFFCNDTIRELINNYDRISEDKDPFCENTINLTNIDCK